MKIPKPKIFDVHSHISRQIVSTIPSCLISMCCGLTYGITAAMLPQLRLDKSMLYEASSESWIASISSLSAIIGSVSIGQFLDRFGRRKAHITLGVPYVIGWAIIACAQSTTVIIIGRFFTGLSSGANKAVMLVYIGEIASPNIRTVAMIVPSIVLNIGVLLSHTICYHLHWRISAYICIVPAVLVLVSSYFLKESPLWLISKGKLEMGTEMFNWFRGTDNASEAELKVILQRQSEKPKMTVKETFKVVCSSAFIKPMLVLFVVMINVQSSGLTVLVFYSQDVFRETFSGKIDPFIMMVVMDCIVGVVSTSFCFLGKYISKKTSYMVSNFGVSISVAGLVACIILEKPVWISVLCLVFYLCFSTAILTLGWTYVPELLPGSARGLGSGLNTMFAGMSLFALVKVTPGIMQLYGASTIFAMYGISSFICGLLLCFILPETDGKTLQSIEDGYNEKKFASEIPL